MKSYHFDVGDSGKGPIGFCARVRAKSKAGAVAALRAALAQAAGCHMVYEARRGDTHLPGIEYIQVYFGAKNIAVRDIDMIDPVNAR